MKQNSCIALINEIVHDMSDCFFFKRYIRNVGK